MIAKIKYITALRLLTTTSLALGLGYFFMAISTPIL